MKSKALQLAVIAILFLISDQTIAQTQVWQQTYTVAGSTLTAGSMVSNSSGIFTSGQEAVNATGVIKLRVAKHNYSGGLLYTNAFQFGSAVTDISTKLSLDDAGNIYVLVYAHKNATYTSDCYVISYSPTLAFRWATIINYADIDMAVGLIIKPGGNLYALIDFKNISSSQINNIGIKKLNTSTGAVLYNATYASGSVMTPKDIVADASGNVYVCATDRYSPTNRDGLLLRFNSSGTLSWASYYTASTSTEFESIALDNFGTTVYVCGSTFSTSANSRVALVLKYNTSGANTASFTYNPASSSRFLKIACEVSGSVSVYGSGSFTDFLPYAISLNVLSLSSNLSTILSSSVHFCPHVAPLGSFGDYITVITNPNGSKLIKMGMREVLAGGAGYGTWFLKINTAGTMLSNDYNFGNGYKVSAVDLTFYANTDYIRFEYPDFTIKRFTGPAARYANDIDEGNKVDASDLTIYPNPATTSVNITGITNVDDLSLFDMHGKQFNIAASSTPENSIKLNVSDLPSGVYFIRNKNSPTTPTRFVVTH